MSLNLHPRTSWSLWLSEFAVTNVHWQGQQTHHMETLPVLLGSVSIVSLSFHAHPLFKRDGDRIENSSLSWVLGHRAGTGKEYLKICLTAISLGTRNSSPSSPHLTSHTQRCAHAHTPKLVSRLISEVWLRCSILAEWLSLFLCLWKKSEARITQKKKAADKTWDWSLVQLTRKP